MNGDLFDPIEAENLDNILLGEDTYDGEDSDYGEENLGRMSPAQAARMRAERARAARMNAARRQAARMNAARRQALRVRPQYLPPQPSGRPPDPTLVRQGFTRVGQDMQRTKAAVQQVDLENKVQSDMIARALATQGKRITGNEYALAASKVVDEFKAQFPDLVSNDIVKTALPLAPLLFLQPQKRGDGFLSVATDPRVWGPVLAAALTLVSKLSNQNQEPQEVTIEPGTFTLGPDVTLPFRAVARDRNGKIISGRSFRWGESSNGKVITVDTATGLVKATGPGSAVITATETATNVSGVGVVTVARDSQG